MRHLSWTCLLLLAIGCGLQPGSKKPVPFPAIQLGNTREITASAGSATAESRWIQIDVSYQNNFAKSFWVGGYSASSPFYGMETRPGKEDEWEDYGMGFCGTGARAFEIRPGDKHTFNVALPEKYEASEVRVLLHYYLDSSTNNPRQVKLAPIKLVVNGKD